jgi:hypothetical protein
MCGSKASGWHGGTLLEQPPLNIKGHFMQRRRWILGRLQNIDKFPFIHGFEVTFELINMLFSFHIWNHFTNFMVSFSVSTQPVGYHLQYHTLYSMASDDCRPFFSTIFSSTRITWT